MPRSPVRSLNDGSYDEDAYELKDFKKRSKRIKDVGNATRDSDENEHGGRRSTDSSVQSFELYTPDEERVVKRKLDVHVVLFMSFLYLLSFLDRSSEPP